MNIITKKLLNCELEIIDIKDFKEFYHENINRFNGFSQKAFLKAIDIPAPYFLEQPDETREELLDNKECLIQNAKKYADKCLVILSREGEILNACKMTNEKEELAYDQLSTIEDVKGIVWGKTFFKDGIVQGFIPLEQLKKDKYNRCLVIDFPIMLNKPASIHDAFYKMPTETSIVDTDNFYYNTSEDIDFMEFQHIEMAINSKLEEEREEIQPVNERRTISILRDNDDIVTNLVEEKVIPKTLILGLSSLLAEKTKFETLTHAKLVEYLLAFEDNLKNLKQVTQLRNCFNFIKVAYASEREEKEEVLA